jgi:hypothetical protein
MSLLESIALFWTQVAGQDVIKAVLKDPTRAGALLETICASNWMVMFDLMWSKISNLGIDLKAIEDKWRVHSARLMNGLKSTLIRANEWRRRLNWISEEVEASLQGLGLYSFATKPEDDAHIDLRYTFARIEILKSKY